MDFEKLQHKKLGLIVANEVARDYSLFMSLTLDDAIIASKDKAQTKGLRYLKNKIDAVNASVNKCNQALNFDLEKQDPIFREVIAHNLNLIFEITVMEESDQKRIIGLINKIKKEKFS